MTNQAASKVFLEDLTSAELRAAMSRHPLVLLPLGSQEDQGAHAPMGDFRLAGAIAGRIAEAARALGSAVLVAPTLPFGTADHFGMVPGGLALSPASFRAVLHDLIGDLRRNGLERIVLLNGHGGNVPIIHEVTLAIRRAGGPVIPSVYLWKIARELMVRRLGTGDARFGHGGEPLASIGLALRGDAMRPDFAVAPARAGVVAGYRVAGFGAIRFEGIEIDAPVEYHEVAPNSAVGDATGADAALGAAVVDDLVALIARFCVNEAGRS
jgi:creatinine amidohydrolase